jgi:hypothetical protein
MANKEERNPARAQLIALVKFYTDSTLICFTRVACNSGIYAKPMIDDRIGNRR